MKVRQAKKVLKNYMSWERYRKGLRYRTKTFNQACQVYARVYSYGLPAIHGNSQRDIAR